ncbi:MAG: cobalamin-dependent protein [Candidatus Jordarchaeaceae archaeon]
MPENTINKLQEAIINGESDAAKEAIQKLLKERVKPIDVIKGMGKAMDEVGKKYENKEYFVPDLVMAAEAMSEGLKLILPQLQTASKEFLGKIVMGVCQGDVHDIGKNIVVAMLRGAGFYVVDLGIDVSPQKFIETIKKEKPQIVGASSYISTTIDELRKLNEEMKKAGVRKNVKYLIGGASVYPKHVGEVGADAFANDALEAVEVAKKLVKA